MFHMFNPFARIRHHNELEIESIKKKRRDTTKAAHQSLKKVNSVLTNGFAIKVYHAHGGKHGNS